jgi:hypothetical protein
VTIRIRVLALPAFLPMALYCQTGSLVGSVASDSLGHPIAGADIRLPALGVTRAANYAGEFRFDGLPPGRVVVAIRSIGFHALQDTIIIVGGRVVQREYVLLKQVVALDSIRVTANSERHISPLLRGFEERKRAGFGHFIDEDCLAQERRSHADGSAHDAYSGRRGQSRGSKRLLGIEPCDHQLGLRTGVREATAQQRTEGLLGHDLSRRRSVLRSCKHRR